MTWTYIQATGELLRNGVSFGFGYSGAPGHVNETASERLKGLGPIPRGLYRLGAPVDHETCGPLSLPLTPVDHDALGRSGFYVHGDNSRFNQSASRGCPIFSRKVRLALASALVDFLVV